MAHGYAVANALTGLAASAFTWSTADTATRAKLNDGLQDEEATSGTATTTPITLTIDFGAPTSLVGWAFLDHDFAAGWGNCEVSIIGADDSGFTTNVTTPVGMLEISLAPPSHRDTVLQFSARSRRYWRISFTNNLGPQETVRMGELFAISSLTSLSRLKAYGWGESEEYIQNRVASRTGNVRVTTLAGPIRSKSLPFKTLQGASDREELMAMWRATEGGAKNLLWVESVDTSQNAASQECLWGKLQPTLGWVEGDFTIFDMDGLELRGLGRRVGR